MAYREQSTERQRFRSFAERYLIARAPFFEKRREEEDAWECMLRARAIFKRLDAYSSSFDGPFDQHTAPTAATQGTQAGGLP